MPAACRSGSWRAGRKTASRRSQRPGSMFKRRHRGTRRTVTLVIEDEPVAVVEGETVAAALFAAGLPWFRTTALSGLPRAPGCMMGVCFDCFVEIDGEANRQARLVTVREGLTRTEERRG